MVKYISSSASSPSVSQVEFTIMILILLSKFEKSDSIFLLVMFCKYQDLPKVTYESRGKWGVSWPLCPFLFAHFSLPISLCLFLRLRHNHVTLLFWSVGQVWEKRRKNCCSIVQIRVEKDYCWKGFHLMATYCSNERVEKNYCLKRFHLKASYCLNERV